MRKLHRGVLACVSLLCLTVLHQAYARPVFIQASSDESGSQAKTPAYLKNLRFRNIGPAAGGRVCRVAGVPGDPLTYYAATAAGGIWVSTDGGINWQSTTDTLKDASFGSIAIAPSNPNIIYAGAGEANIRGDVVLGHGIYKSTDAGKTWKHVWVQPGQIGTMAVHPANPDIAFAAVLGNCFGPNKERGIYRTTDGGKSWQQVLAKDENIGASDVCIDPNNPLIVFAGMWQARRQPWTMTSGPGGSLHMSKDGGDTWVSLKPPDKSDLPFEGPGRGLPEGAWGKVGVAVAPSDSRRVYALIEADKGGLFRSDDGGETWRLASSDQSLRQRAWYYSTVTVDPTNADVVWCPNVPLLRSIDGGRTFNAVRGPHHGDHHDIWIDPKNPKRMINGNDGGVDLSLNGGETWTYPHLPISQFYHVRADNQVPYHVFGCMQDLGSASGPSNSLGGGIGLGEWQSVGGGEAGYAVADPFDPNIVYAGEYGGYLSRYDRRTGQARNISVYPASAVGKGGEELRYRFQWTAPILTSQHERGVVYHGSQVVHKTTNGGQTWTNISGDLTRNDKSKQKWSGGPITGDNTGVEVYCTVFAMAESPLQKDLLWVGSDDGLVHVTRDGGKSWENVTKNISGIPEWGTISCIEPSPFEAGTAYVVVDAHRLANPKPYLYKTTDFGKSWACLSDQLPQDVCLRAVREDPKRKGLLYVGTEEGVAFSSDDGNTWHPLKLNLPTAPVHDLIVKDNDLIVGTHGRSIWILDDLTPLRRWSADIAEKALHVFPAADTIRWKGSTGRSGGRQGVFPNPPRGAVIHYYLKSKPKGEMTLEIMDAHKKVIAKLSSRSEPSESGDESPRRFRQDRTALPTTPGLHRIVWDLSYDGPTTIRGAMSWPGAPSSGPTALPGEYQLRLTVDGQSETVPLVIKPDPRVTMEIKDLEEQLKLALEVREDITKLSKTVQQLRSVKTQLTDRANLWKAKKETKLLADQCKEIIKKLDTIEEGLHNPKAKITYDLLAQKGGCQVYSQLCSVYSTLTSTDGAPTQGVREHLEEQRKLFARLDADWRKVLQEDLPKLNDEAKKMDVIKP